jgi:hypothetical protein
MCLNLDNGELTDDDKPMTFIIKHMGESGGKVPCSPTHPGYLCLSIQYSVPDWLTALLYPPCGPVLTHTPGLFLCRRNSTSSSSSMAQRST